MSPPLRPIAAFLLAPLLFATAARAATYLSGGYTLRVWQTEDGLPQNLVTSGVQTRDGYLWFGTFNGLTRFDGERFQVFTPGNTPDLRDRRISQLFEDAQGTLWIGHDNGAITRWHDGRFQTFASPSGVDNEDVIGLGADSVGQLWAMRRNGAIYNVDHKDQLPSLIAPEHPGIMGWTRGQAGGIWVLENGRVAHLANGQLTPLTLESLDINCVAASASGGVWILGDGRIRKWQDGRWTEDRGRYPWGPGSLASCLELQDGTLAVGTIHFGLYLVFPDGRESVHFDRGNGLPQDWVRFLYEDREGTLWAGTGAGLVSIHSSAFSILDTPDQRQGCTVTSVAPDRHGGLWIGTDGAGLYRYFEGKWSHYGAAEGLANPYIQSVTETAGGQIWAGDFWWGSPYRLENGRFVQPGHVDSAWSPALALLAVPGTDDLLVGNRDGLLKLSGDRSAWLIKSPQGKTDDVSAIAIDGAGDIWCGFARGGLARVSPTGKTTLFRREDGLASDAVQCLLADSDGALWIGTTDSGLTRLKNGRFARLGPEQGLADSSICYIMDDGRGNFWLSTRRGIQRIAKTELNRCADGLVPALTSPAYNRNDGLPIVEFTGGRQGAGCKTPDGRLWFASSHGVVSVDPAKIVPNRTPPPVVLESLLVDGEGIRLGAGDPPGRLRPDHQRLEFRYSGLSFVAPNKVLFRYRLEGIDRNWIEAGSKRTAFYSRLPAGTYRFRVIACNNDGVWNTSGATLAFTVAPFFWQTWWFIGSSLLAAAGMIAWLARFVTRRRMQRRIEQVQRQHEIERERARIAQDIHDDVGASLSRIAMLSQPADMELAEPERAAAMLSRIYSTAREVTRALDEIVWAVDPRHDTLDSLVDYMSKFAQHFLEPTGVRCRLDLPVEVPAWPLTAEIRHNLFLAFKEALNNAAKHASANEVRISFRLQPDSFLLTVTDNGRGFSSMRPPSAEPDRVTPGNGLANMQARLAGIGGRCEIGSAPGKGTKVSFTVNVTTLPARAASPPPSASVH